ncbi:hypothetical protein E4U35_001996 [Claviceps purpurea]|nr:hypothetical protein E4U27_003361 [Claviceps purpurea]KAG6206094.1 hypothetical protein E4U35_001996 [Claviceps purpurea]
MVSTRVNVFRWSALGAGLFYGFIRQRSITISQRAAHEKHEYESKQKLIEQAKAEWAKKNSVSTPVKDDAATDISSPNFDLEKFLSKLSN